jgi:hypothetical protein
MNLRTTQYGKIIADNTVRIENWFRDNHTRRVFFEYVGHKEFINRKRKINLI